MNTTIPWLVAAVALIAVVAMLAGQFFGSREPANTVAAAGAAEAPFASGGGAMNAPDISSMSPQERADRLFERVMRYATEGKADSAQFFAPMAMGAIAALAPLTTHHHYDLGLIALAANDAAMARAEADTILKERPTHLLGLALAARAADARGDAAARAGFEKKLLAAEPQENKSAFPEYHDHERDLQAALVTARSRAK